MKQFIFCLGVLNLGLSLEAKAEPLARLFESTKLWNEPVQDKSSLVSSRKKKKPLKRSVASESLAPVFVQTYVYDDDYSFAQNRAEQSPTRDIAAVAMKGRVIGVRRELSLTGSAGKEVEQEYLVNAGSRLGLAKGTKLKVYRTLPVVDPFNGNKQHELKVDFATLEVVFVEEDVAVTQLVKLTDATVGPFVGLRGVLVGDYVSLR